jgi:hypothetical protein
MDDLGCANRYFENGPKKLFLLLYLYMSTILEKNHASGIKFVKFGKNLDLKFGDDKNTQLSLGYTGCRIRVCKILYVNASMA